ncbi:M23 family metallopeptidase [Paraburkholderia lacunae]|uniref:M23 family metallopeptidase n=1 Tax=Paraburkholderia lacunae TaxID=2211104 RepID=UPI001FCB4892|nr:M23 family metallopeptidase [Paraburkholderia lacunae]
MIVSPPFLPIAGTTSTNLALTDPMMSIVDDFELAHGIYPIAFDRRWHTGVHLYPATRNEKVRAIADGEVVAYRECQHAIDGGSALDSNAGFVLLKHTSETGDGRTLTFYSLYMHLLELSAYNSVGVSGNDLPEFLRMPSPGGILNPAVAPPAQAGSGKKVSRKDVLGLPGRCHGQRHIHFEIFMLPDDFDHYFGATQLGNTQPHTPAGTDYWGHSYFIIPAGQTFVAQPPGTVDGKLQGIAFDALQSGQNEQPLHIESYFHRGSRYTSVWSVATVPDRCGPQPAAPGRADPSGHAHRSRAGARRCAAEPRCAAARL